MIAKSFSRAVIATAMLGAMMIGTSASAQRPSVKISRGSMPSAMRQAGVQRPMTDLVLSTGRGQLINLPAGISDVFVSNDTVADVQVRSATQIYVFAKAKGEATVYATTPGGQVAYSANVRVGTNLSSLDQMLRLAMPEAAITATTMNGLVLLTGTIASPDDAAEAERLVKAFSGEGVEVVSRLRTATPLQVSLHVKIAEVSRSLAKSIGSNITTRDQTGGDIGIGVFQGRSPGTFNRDPTTGRVIGAEITAAGSAQTTIGFLGRLFGVDVLSAFDLAETTGLVTLLAEPNLTALSGETASFLAGGEFPIPISQTLGQVTVEYKQYGVSLAFTPTVLADGRISMRVRPEVSQLSGEGAVTLNNFTIPAITTRRTETTVELGSGQSFMIGGLLQNNNSNSISKAPGLGDVPVLGALFRSNGYRRNQTELMIIVTPYLVKPVSANQIALPTDGLKTPNDLEAFLLGQDFKGTSGAQRPKPSMAPPVTVPPPVLGAAVPPAPTRSARQSSRTAQPGFSN